MLGWIMERPRSIGICGVSLDPPVLSEATIHRILVRRGLVVPQPKKRPKSSFRRFVAPAPNDLWQIDHTDRVIAAETVNIFNIVDDHSRVLIRSRAVSEATTQQAWITFSQGAEMASSKTS